MIWEKFFDALGQIDDKYISEVLSYSSRRNAGTVRRKWLAAVACLSLIIVGASFLFVLLDPPSSANHDDEPGDLPPLIYVNDQLYLNGRYDGGLSEDAVYIGKIRSYVADEVPSKNFQANDPFVGSKLYQYGENIILVYEDSFLMYYPIE